MNEFLSEIGKLSSAEDFLTFLEVPHDPKVVQVNRLHILKRFHDYLGKAETLADAGPEEMRAAYRTLLEKAYLDFVASDALTEKVFPVFHRTPPGKPAFVSLSSIRSAGS